MKGATFTSIQSERLLLRRFAESDLRPFLAYRNDPAVARYQTWETYDERQARDAIERQKNADPGTPGRWFTFALESKETGELVGHVALKTQEDGQQAEIGFTLAREFHGLGLAFEAASRVLDYAFADLGLHRVTAITDCENRRSVTLLDRLGMRREAHFVRNVWLKDRWGDEYSYAILREEWRRARAT